MGGRGTKAHFLYVDLPKVVQNTIEICKVTHADPRCIASCVAVTSAIALMLQGKYPFSHSFSLIVVLSLSIETYFDGSRNFDEVIRESERLAKQSLGNDQVVEFEQCMNARSLSELVLDENGRVLYTHTPPLCPHIPPTTLSTHLFTFLPPLSSIISTHSLMQMGYTYKSLGSAFYALKHEKRDFRKAITNITMEGGDADSNAVVAGMTPSLSTLTSPSSLTLSLHVPLFPSLLYSPFQVRCLAA